MNPADLGTVLEIQDEVAFGVQGTILGILESQAVQEEVLGMHFQEMALSEELTTVWLVAGTAQSDGLPVSELAVALGLRSLVPAK